MSMTKTVLLLLASALCSCASVDSQRASLSSGEPCCRPMPQSSLLQITDKPLQARVTEADPVIKFSTGNSRAKFIELAVGQQRPARLFLRSVPSFTNVYAGGGSWGPTFFPAVTFLDEGWKQLGPTLQSSTERHPKACQIGSRCAIGSIAVAVPKEARYMVLHTSNAMVGVTRAIPVQETVLDQTYMIRGTLVTVPGGGQAFARVIAMSVGQVEIGTLADQ